MESLEGKGLTWAGGTKRKELKERKGEARKNRKQRGGPGHRINAVRVAALSPPWAETCFSTVLPRHPCSSAQSTPATLTPACLPPAFPFSHHNRDSPF